MRKKIKISTDLYSLFSYMVALLLVFMFRNNESYFNINNYKMGLIVIICSGIFILLYTWVIKDYKLTISQILILFSWISLMISKYVLDKQAEPYYILFVSFLLLFLLCMSEMQFSQRNMKFLIDSYIVSAVIMSLLIIVQHRTPYAQYGIFRLALFFNSKEYYDVNFTSLYLLLPTLLAFYGAIKGKKKNKIWYMGAMGINIIGILLLGSRGTFLPVAAIMLFLILKDKKISFTKILIIMVAVFAIVYLLPEDTFTRLLKTDYMGSEHKRYIDWAYGLRVFGNSPIWGNGMRAPKSLVNEIGGGVMNYTIHNTYIVYLAQLGILGSLPFLGILIYPLVMLVRKCREIYLVLSYCGVLFACMMIEANYSYVLFVPLAMIYMLINGSMRERGNKKYILDNIFG